MPGDDDLPAVDLGFAAAYLPMASRLVRSYFGLRVAGMEKVPDTGPVLFVANHSGGTASPDSVGFLLAFVERFGLDRPLYWLGHSLATTAPALGSFLRRCGVVPASPAMARRVLAAGAALVVYPGGAAELHRPWKDADRICFQGRTGFLQLSQDAGIPITPVVSAGGQHTYLPLTDGRALARWLGLDRLARLDVLPVSLALPWGLNIGDFLLHLPLPARISIEVMDLVAPEAWAGDLAAGYDQVTAAMQATLDHLSAPGPAREAGP